MTECVLKIQRLNKKFGELNATDNLSLELHQGEIHALIGPNGAGKSTLIKQICGELDSDSGSIEFLGSEINTLDVAARAALGLGRTYQVSSLLMQYSALRNVMLAVQSTQGSSYHFFKAVAKDRQLRAQALTYLQAVGLEKRADISAAELAHGERRQLEIAIVLALKPKAFLLDEPMAGMGTQGSLALTKFLDNLRHQAPILLVEHDMDAVFSLADRISVMVYGKIIATGSVEQIRQNPQVREAYLGEL